MLQDRGQISNEPYDLARWRRVPEYSFLQEYAPPGNIGIDNSGAAIPTVANQNLPFLRLTTGANGINKTQEYSNACLAAGDGPPTVDGFAVRSDPNGHGFWRRKIILDCLIRPQAVAGALTDTSRCGIELGTFGVVPPDPATSAFNCVRLFCDCSTAAIGAGNWYIQSCPGDNATAPVTSPQNNAVRNGTLGRVQRARLIHVPGEYVEGWIDGIMIGRLTTALPIPDPINNSSMFGCFVTSGAGSANVRAVFSSAAMRIIFP